MSDTPVTENRRTELLEALAELEHEQWAKWAMAILDTEDISQARRDRWKKLLFSGGYRYLTEEQKEQDREWAERVLWIVKKHMDIR